ncbi:hypothetical protein CIC12_29085 [Burkholderia sp. SG-MS1]|uniref:cytochrome P450 n=1 Tax=Paraburkholderia sp. SG-MS1 TaxID=2023741 RepID=UPI001446A6F0|nr:cytochrome P450 [Paraburkholderia sp. SG-MS1]NKJ50706.1 hypothetical protein [Paraburkholderia sp. SG-MS1]
MKTPECPIQNFPIFPPARDPEHPLDPPPALLKMRAEGGVARIKQWDGVDAWVFTEYETVRTALNDNRLSADPTRPGYPEKSAAYKQSIGKDRNLRTMDGAEHAVQKKMLLRDFSTKRVEEMRPAIKQKIESLIDNIIANGPTFDLVKDFALPIPTMVICEMLGVPFGDREYFSEKSNVCTSTTASSEEAASAAKELYDYMEHLIDIKQARPDNDLVSRLVEEQLKPGLLSRKEVIEMARFILIAGHETTANMIALSTIALLHHPDQAELLRTNRDAAFVTNAVDELLRYLSVTHTGRRRVAVEDMEIAGQQIKAGEGVILLNSVGDRDESIFPNADRLDLTRKNARNHMAFGGGIHRCTGAALSKCELELVHDSIWKRLPNLALGVPASEIPYYDSGSVYGVRSVPLIWGR